MPTDVIITGTGAPNPVPGRAGAGTLVRHGDCVLQFDAGRSTVERLAGAGVSTTELTAFFATHHHSDHLTGLQDLVLTRWVLDGRGELPPLPIVVPHGPLEAFVDRMLDPWEHDIATRKAHSGRTVDPTVALTPFDVPDVPTEIWRSGDVRVHAVRVRHEPVHPSVGYRVETPDGVVAISGDTSVCGEVAELAADADVLVHEALRVEMVERLPFLSWIIDCHADTRALGKQAAELEVPNLVLTHLIPPPSTPEETAAFEADVRGGGYTGCVIVANDLDVVTLDCGRAVRSI